MNFKPRNFSRYQQQSVKPTAPRAQPNRTPEMQRIPMGVEVKIEQYIEAALGADWKQAQMPRMRDEILKLKKRYWNFSGTSYGMWPTLAYLAYHFPAYYCQMRNVYSNLLSCGIIKEKMRILEVGAGTGAPARAFADFLPEVIQAEYDALEPYDDSVKAMKFILDGANPLCKFNFIEKPIEQFTPTAKYDLILMANVASELRNPEEAISKLMENFIAPGGSLVVVEPAELRISTQLREMQRAFHKKYTVFAPCTYLWGPRCEGRCWSFVQVPDIAPTKLQREISNGEKALMNVDIKYSHFILRKGGAPLKKFRGNPRMDARMMDMERHVERRINLTCAKMSGNLSENTNLFKICDGSARHEHYAVLNPRDVSESNRGLIDAEYGEILRFRNVLVLESKKENAYNLVIGKNTEVERLEKPRLKRKFEDEDGEDF
ncbi:MAG: class I SAM-dependent methyltransferase [Candidatus Thermoplasmatota archaeon]|nr:class I SAM-dependent methyltransferase [Candidatus Thermoplasmatota archaeon]